MRSLHQRQKIAYGLYTFLAVFLVWWLGSYAEARGRSVTVGCWGPPIRVILLRPGIPEFARPAFVPLAKIDGLLCGSPVEIQLLNP